jgi:hypothetical protein
MGTRLYVNTQDRAIIETLAGVPAGTFDRLDAINAKHYDDDYDRYCDIQDDPHLAALAHFDLFGFSKFDLRLLPDGKDYACDRTEDGDLAISLWLSSTGAFSYADREIVAPIIRELGVHWS